MDEETKKLTSIRDQFTAWNGSDVTPSINALRAMVWAMGLDSSLKDDILAMVKLEEQAHAEDAAAWQCSNGFESDDTVFVAWYIKAKDCDGTKQDL